jgi:serpin B
MKFFCSTVLAALLALSFLAPARAQTTPLVQDENQFAVALYGRLAVAQPGNFVVSPYSLATALGMVYAGARGQTAAEIASTLHLQGMSLVDLLHEMQAPVLFNAPGGYFEFHAANALWVAPRFPLKPLYRTEVRQNFGAWLENIDFSNGQVAASEINNWITDKTARKIQDLVAPEMFNADTSMVLTNAVYFNADWVNHFRPEDDQQRNFHVSPGHDVPVMMMWVAGNFTLAQTAQAQILTLPYTGDASMIVILPNSQTGLPALEANLSPAELNKWLATGESTPVSLALPKFTQTSQFDVKEVLRMLGMKQAFDTVHADFTGISDAPGQSLYVSDILQKAHIDVDEKGTEAATASVGMMVLSLSAPPFGEVFIRGDHPFLYLIRANSTGAILFMGRVDNPAAD